MPLTIRVSGANAVLQKMDRLKRMDAVRSGLEKAAKHVEGVIKKYPPETIANWPSNPKGKWYERGYGFRWHLPGGGLGGKKTSEKLGTKWSIHRQNGGMTQLIRNVATYSRYVHDKERQFHVHKRTGWKVDEEVANSEKSAILNYVNMEVAKVARS